MTEPRIHAGLFLRGMALFLDLLAVLAAWILLDVAGIPYHPIVNLSVLAVYFILFTASPLQATPGKRLLWIKVTDVSGRRIGLGRAAVRFAVSVASVGLAGLGLIVAAWTPGRQALHDLAARTRVVTREAPSEAIAAAPPSPLSVSARVGFTVLILAGALATDVAVQFGRVFLRREAMLGILGSLGAYAQEVKRAKDEGRPVPPAGWLPSHARAMYLRSDGAIVVEGKDFFEGGTIAYTPRLDASGTFSWQCRAQGFKDRDLPPNCRP